MKADTDTVLDVTDSTLPDGFVQTGVDADVFKMNSLFSTKWFVLTFSSHGLTGKGADGVNGLWCTVLETDAMDALKET